MKINYVLIPFVGALTALVGSFITRDGMEWYKDLVLPSWTPDGAIIGFVWTIIYTLSVLVALVVWNTSAYAGNKSRIIILFALNAFLNAGWTYLFFGIHLIAAAFIEMILLEATVVALIFYIRKTSVLVALLLYPYALWVGFASLLTYSVLNLNS